MKENMLQRMERIGAKERMAKFNEMMALDYAHKVDYEYRADRRGRA